MIHLVIALSLSMLRATTFFLSYTYLAKLESASALLEFALCCEDGLVMSFESGIFGYWSFEKDFPMYNSSTSPISMSNIVNSILFANLSGAISADKNVKFSVVLHHIIYVLILLSPASL